MYTCLFYRTIYINISSIYQRINSFTNCSFLSIVTCATCMCVCVCVCVFVCVGEDKVEDDNDECLIHRVVKYLPYEVAVPIFDVLVDVSGDFLLLKDDTGSVPLHHALDNLNINSDAIIKLIVANSDAVIAKDRKGMTSLHKAVIHSNLSPEIISFMLAVCPSSVTEKTIRGELPLHLLLSSGGSASSSKVKEAVFNILLEADIESVKVDDAFGRLPIHSVLSKPNPNVPIVEALIKIHRESLSAVDVSKNTPLHLAVAVNSLHCVKICLSLYMPAATMHNSDGLTPLIIGLKEEGLHYNPTLIKEMLSMCPQCGAVRCSSGEKLPEGGYAGDYPLHYAMNLHPTDLKVISALVRSFPKAVDVPFMGEKTISPLKRAVKISDTVIIDIMLSGGMESLMTSTIVDDDTSVEPQQDEGRTLNESGGLTQEQYDHYKEIFLYCSNKKGETVSRKGLKLMFNVLGEKNISTEEQTSLLAKGKLNLYEFLEFMRSKFASADSSRNNTAQNSDDDEKGLIEQKTADAFADLRMQRPTSKLGSLIKAPTSYFVGKVHLYCPFLCCDFNQCLFLLSYHRW